MSTKAQVLKALENVADDEIIAVPTIKTKADAEELYIYMNDEEVTLTSEQWKDIVSNYEDAGDYSDEYLLELIEEVVGDM